jgi:DNA-binding LacI/PurR family transcriptional regulator
MERAAHTSFTSPRSRSESGSTRRNSVCKSANDVRLGPALDHAFFARITDAFQVTLIASGYMVLIITVGFDNTQIVDKIRQLIERGAEALMLVGRVEDQSLLTCRASLPRATVP